MTLDNPGIECRNLTCGYPGRTVLRDVSFSLAEGAITALLGPNGSGKSTLLKTIGKTLSPLSGEVFVRGDPVAGLSFRDLAKLVAFVPQEEETIYGFTSEQVVVMGRLARSAGFFDTAEDHEAAVHAMQDADCLYLRARSVTELSSGEKQRVLIARALAQGGRILLMDEPTSHLDVGHQVAISGLLRSLAAKGYLIFAAVHDLNLAAAIADDGILLEEDGIGLHAPIRRVLSDEATDRVYGVAFRRIEPEEGRIYMFPPNYLAP